MSNPYARRYHIVYANPSINPSIAQRSPRRGSSSKVNSQKTAESVCTRLQSMSYARHGKMRE
jgi:hypothetical protein